MRFCETLLAPDVPRTNGGGVALCHFHQRGAFNAGGVVRYLIRELVVDAGKGSSDQRRLVWHWRFGHEPYTEADMLDNVRGNRHDR